MDGHLNPHPPGIAVRGQLPFHALIEGGGVSLLGPDLVHQDVIPVPEIVMMILMMTNNKYNVPEEVVM